MTLLHRPLPPLATVAALSALLLGGCAPAPSPIATPPPAFTSEAEAFAAAEEVYRAYNEAFNAIDLSQPASFEPVFSLTTGDFQRADRKTLSELHAEGYALTGSTEMVFFAPFDVSSGFERLTAIVCVDVSKSDVTGSDGLSVLPDSRPDINPLRVTFVVVDGALLIDHADRDGELACAD